jgi:hypothetical protein
MPKLTESKQALRLIGMPAAQQSDICGYTLLAMADVKETSPWITASSNWIRIHDIIVFIRENYGIAYAENSRETFRKQALHHFRNAALIEDNGKATNSPNYRYRITQEALGLIRTFSTPTWEQALSGFQSRHARLIDLYRSKKEMQKMPVLINGAELTFSPGKHNELQKAILEEFAPRFAPGSMCLYVGDTIVKDLIKNVVMLTALGFEITLHDKMPDVVLYQEEKNWLFFIESVTSSGPMDAKRIRDIQSMTKDVRAGKIFVTAFLSKDTFKKFIPELAWETEVWIAADPDHMIHMNGDKFLGPR